MIKNNKINILKPFLAVKYNLKKLYLLVTKTNSKQVEYVTNQYIQSIGLDYQISFIYDNGTISNCQGNIDQSNISIAFIDNNVDSLSYDAVINISNLNGDYYYCIMDTTLGNLNQILQVNNSVLSIPLPFSYSTTSQSFLCTIHLKPKDQDEALSVLNNSYLNTQNYISSIGSTTTNIVQMEGNLSVSSFFTANMTIPLPTITTNTTQNINIEGNLTA